MPKRVLLLARRETLVLGKPLWQVLTVLVGARHIFPAKAARACAGGVTAPCLLPSTMLRLLRGMLRHKGNGSCEKGSEEQRGPLSLPDAPVCAFPLHR